MIIRIILVLVILIILAWFLGQRATTRGQAGGKMLVLILLAGAIFAVIFPDTTNDVAHSVGVGRGADLLLYGVTVAFLASIIAQYMRQQDEQLKTISLARHIAIANANSAQHNIEIIESNAKTKNTSKTSR